MNKLLNFGWYPLEVNQTLVFVDLETTGATASADRITEIGIVEVGENGVREWSTLVNPGQRIPEFIERLTGITNASVANAPNFESLAGEVLKRLEGRLFIAHNARFDYGFLQNELKRAGHDFRATVLCTVKLSRKLYPQYPKHNLDSLIERHGLDVGDRHRALGDARLIWQFWQKLHFDHPQALIDAAVNMLTARPSLPPQLDQGLIDELPERHGVYLFYGENDLPLYVGKSKQLRKRVVSHLASDKDISLAQQVRRIEWLETAGELGALLKESALVKKLQPTHNRKPRRSAALFTWHLVPGNGGAIRPELALAGDFDLGRSDNLFGLFSSQREATKVLRGVADQHELCHALLGLEKVKAGKPCVSYPLQRCKGGCVGKEALSFHGARLLAAMHRLKLVDWPYEGPVGVREGNDLHVVDDWCYIGTARSEEETWALLEAGRPAFDLDHYQILRKSLPRERVVLLQRH